MEQESTPTGDDFGGKGQGRGQGARRGKTASKAPAAHGGTTTPAVVPPSPPSAFVGRKEASGPSPRLRGPGGEGWLRRTRAAA